MASKNVTIVIDDLTGKELPEGSSETIMFSLDGVAYELDVSSSGAQRLRSAMAPYVRAGRRLTGPRSTRRTKAASNAATVRAWAASRGIEVSNRGRIPASVVAQFEAAGN